MSVLKKHNPLTDQWEYVIVGKRGLPGETGASAYETAVANGYEGTETEWLLSIAEDAAALISAITTTIIEGKGDIIVGTAAGEVIRLPAGTTDGHALQIASAEPSGLIWQAIPDAFTGYFANSATPETPTGGGTLFVQDGALKFIGSSGTVTTIASA